MEFCSANWAAVEDDSAFSELSAKLVRKLKENSDDGCKLATDALDQLSKSELPRRKCVRRLTFLFAQLDLKNHGQRSLTDAVSTMSSQAKSLYASASQDVELAVLYSQAGTAVQSQSNFTADPSIEIPTEVQLLLGGLPGATALILAQDDFHAGSKSLLQSAGISSIRVSSAESLDQYFNNLDDICAVIIDGSFLTLLDADEQKHVFEKIGAYSSLVWTRIDDEGLCIDEAEVERILQVAACKSELSNHCASFGQSGNLRQTELPRVMRACYLVQTSDRGVILPADLSSFELRVVMAAAAEYLRDWQSDLPKELRLRTKLVPGGRTDAKIVLARSDERAEPFIIKVDRREHIHDEMVRFKTFIEPGDSALQPRAVFHGGYGAIVFRLIEGVDEPARPAPTLEQALREIKLNDLYDAHTLHEPAATADAIRNVATKLSRLNFQSPANTSLENYSTPKMSTFERLEATGGGFGFSESVIASRRLAVETFRRLDGRAVVHGDVNLRNILLPGRENASLIDYANSGPGHPAIDLVRLECALLFGAVAMSVDVHCFIRLQRLLTFELAEIDRIRAEVPEIFQMTINDTVVQGCVVARDKVLKVLKQFGGNEADYYAAKALIAWVSLEVEGLQHVLVRATIEMMTDKVT